MRRTRVDALATPVGATPARLVDLAFELDVDGNRHEDDERPEFVGIGEIVAPIRDEPRPRRNRAIDELQALRAEKEGRS